MKRFQILLLIFLVSCGSSKLGTSADGKKISDDLAVLDFKKIDKTWDDTYKQFSKAEVEYGSPKINDVFNELYDNQGECHLWTLSSSITIFQLLYDIDRYYLYGDLYYQNGLTHYIGFNTEYPNEENINAHMYLNLAILSYANETEINRISYDLLGVFGGEEIYKPTFSLAENYINEFARSIKKCEGDIELWPDITTNDLQDMTLNYMKGDQESRMSMYELVIINLFPESTFSLFD
tara:strand:- start:581 stop:1288 length:708 start_codon:yes stop_codon:yes gene_type:complete